MLKNPKCQPTTKTIDCDMEYLDFFKTTVIRGGVEQVRTECLAHAANSESKGRRVELIDQR